MQTGGLVASNDNFNAYRDQFPSLFQGPPRFLRLLVVRGQPQLADDALNILAGDTEQTRPQTSQFCCGECGGAVPGTGMLKVGERFLSADQAQLAEAMVRYFGVPLCHPHLAWRLVLPRCVDPRPASLRWAVIAREEDGRVVEAVLRNIVECAPLGLALPVESPLPGYVVEWRPVLMERAIRSNTVLLRHNGHLALHTCDGRVQQTVSLPEPRNITEGWQTNGSRPRRRGAARFRAAKSACRG